MSSEAYEEARRLDIQRDAPIARQVKARLIARQSVTPKPDVIEPPEPFTIGAWVRVNGWHGLYRCLGGNRDGSLCLYGGAAGRASYRHVPVEKCRLATRAEIRRVDS